MPRVAKIGMWILGIIVVIVGLLAALVWAITFHPAQAQAEPVTCDESAPALQPGQSLKVLTYNIQYLAGKNHFFWYEGGSDERASPEDIGQSLERIAQLIRQENLDVILLQEVDDGSKRSDYQDQLALLLQNLPSDYTCHTSAFYWQAAYVPHPNVRGAIGHKLSIISKFHISQARRIQLPLAPADLLTRQFSPKRAILEARLPVAGGQEFVLLNTHLEVSDRGTEVMQQQVALVHNHLQQLNQQRLLWLIGGDFNLLPPGQVERLRQDQRSFFRPQTELQPLFETYQVIPGPSQINSADEARWFTFFPNDPTINQPDRTLDYIFFADSLSLTQGYVRQDELALIASDHLPVVAEFKLP